MVTQLIARIDERLHRRLKERAAAEGRSMNALVNELLADGVAGDDQIAAVEKRLQSQGLRVIPRVDQRPPSRAAALAVTRGVGSAVSEALSDRRASR